MHNPSSRHILRQRLRQLILMRETGPKRPAWHLRRMQLIWGLHDALAALDGGRGGFACLRRIAREARRHLLPGGCLMLEHGYDQAARLRIYLRELGYVEVQSRDDLAGIARVTLGVMPVAQASTVTV